MALNSLTTATDSIIINDVGIGMASIGIFADAVIGAIFLAKYLRRPTKVAESLRPLPTRMLYLSMALSLLFSVCWILSCSDLASNAVACDFAMWGIIFSTHLINGLLLAILLHCGLLLSSKNARVSTVIVKVAISLVIVVSLGLSIGGLASGRFGYIEDQDTCWMVPTANGSGTDSPYKVDVILLYGPIFACLLFNVLGLAFVWFGIARIRRDGSNMDGTKLRSLVLRLSFSPAFLALHCLMVIGGDLPITYHSRAAQFTSYICNYIGFSALSLALAICAIFFDPALSSIVERKIALSTRSQPRGGTQQITISEHPGSKSCETTGHISETKREVHEIQMSDITASTFSDLEAKGSIKTNARLSSITTSEINKTSNHIVPNDDLYDPVFYVQPATVPDPLPTTLEVMHTIPWSVISSRTSSLYAQQTQTVPIDHFSVPPIASTIPRPTIRTASPDFFDHQVSTGPEPLTSSPYHASGPVAAARRSSIAPRSSSNRMSMPWPIVETEESVATHTDR